MVDGVEGISNACASPLPPVWQRGSWVESKSTVYAHALLMPSQWVETKQTKVGSELNLIRIANTFALPCDLAHLFIGETVFEVRANANLKTYQR